MTYVYKGTEITEVPIYMIGAHSGDHGLFVNPAAADHPMCIISRPRAGDTIEKLWRDARQLDFTKRYK